MYHIYTFIGGALIGRFVGVIASIIITGVMMYYDSVDINYYIDLINSVQNITKLTV